MLAILVSEIYTAFFRVSLEVSPTLSWDTERPRVYIPNSSMAFNVLSVAVTGDMISHDLREVARRVQEDLLKFPGISIANVKTWYFAPFAAKPTESTQA